MNKTEQHKKAIIEALEKTLGVVTEACKKARVGRTTYYGWLESDKEFAKKVKSIEDVAIDFAETALHDQIREGNPTSTIFYLKTKGKKRGYIEKSEIEVQTEKPIFQGIDLSVTENDSTEKDS